MNILVVDDEKLALKNIVKELEKAFVVMRQKHKDDMSGLDAEHEIHAFSDAGEALDYAEAASMDDQETEIDVAFLDVEMRGASGLELAKSIKQIYPRVNVIFTTGHTDYMESAFGLHASGYCLKPITAEKLINELENLRHAVYKSDAEVSLEEKVLVVRTFGNFEAYVGDTPIHFKYSKSKELLAYLIDRNGALCSNREIMCVLWEDTVEDHISYMKKIKNELIARLKLLGCENVLVQHRGVIGVVPGNIKCDYFDYLAGVSEAEKAYRGEYMSQYTWGEYTHGLLEA